MCCVCCINDSFWIICHQLLVILKVEVNAVCHREAVDSMDGLQCSIQVLRRLKRLAMSVLKDPSTLTEAQVFDLGNIIGSLLALFYRRNILVLFFDKAPSS